MHFDRYLVNNLDRDTLLSVSKRLRVTPTFVLFSPAHFICYWIFFWLTIAAIFIAYDPLGK